MTILPIVKLEKEEEKGPDETPPAPDTPLSPNRFGSSSPSPSSSAFFPPPRTPPSPPRDREKPFIAENWEVERRDNGRRRRRVVGTTRTTTPRSPVVDTRERNNSDDEYDVSSVYDCHKERMYEKLLKENKGLIIKRCTDDGACLFRSVADQLYGDQEMHGVVRIKCMDYMVKNRDYFSQFVTEDYMSYINRKRQDNCYGNQLEMQAMSEMYNRPIEVYIYSIEPVNTLGYHLKTDYPPIRLSYHCNCHYNSVRDPYEPSIGVGLGLPGYKPGLPDQQLLQEGLTKSEADDIERIMMQDKLESTDMEATADAITAAIARESYMEWVKQNERGSAETGPSGSSVAGSSAALEGAPGHSGYSGTAACSSSEQGPSSSSSSSGTNQHQAAPNRTPPHSSTSIPTDSTPLHTLYPVYGLDEYDEEKMLEAALALSRAEYVNKMQRH